MSILHDEGDEGETRIGRMIDEFRTAQSRRAAKATGVKSDGRAMELPRDADARTAVAASIPKAGTKPQE